MHQILWSEEVSFFVFFCRSIDSSNQLERSLKKIKRRFRYTIGPDLEYRLQSRYYRRNVVLFAFSINDVIAKVLVNLWYFNFKNLSGMTSLYYKRNGYKQPYVLCWEELFTHSPLWISLMASSFLVKFGIQESNAMSIVTFLYCSRYLIVSFVYWFNSATLCFLLVLRACMGEND